MYGTASISTFVLLRCSGPTSSSGWLDQNSVTVLGPESDQLACLLLIYIYI